MLENENRFFNETEKDELMNMIINTNYENEDEVWDLALELEHISIMLRRAVLEQNYEKE